MANALDLIGWNFLVSLLMGGCAWLLCRTATLRSRPALCHGLWLLVLVKLITPPLVPVPLLPALAAQQVNESAPVVNAVDSPRGEMPGLFQVAEDTPRNEIGMIEGMSKTAEALANDAIGPPPGVEGSLESISISWQTTLVVLLAVSLCITGALWLAAFRQTLRVRRLLRNGAAQSGRAAELLRETSQGFRLRATPRLLIVDASITPMLWAEPTNATIVLPKQLADSLDDDPLRCIFAHELAHFARRDHWTNMLAFFVTTLFWWNPVAWIARRELAMAAEACCDALAVSRLPGSRKAYAKTLLQVGDFGTSCRPLQPAWGITFGGSHSLRRRIEMLANSNVRTDVSRAGWLLLALGCLTLTLLPARAEEKSAPEEASQTTSQAADDNLAQPATDGKCYVTGIVSDQLTRQPIAGATVNILVDEERGPEKKMRSGISDSDGRYRIEVPLGSVRLWFPRLKSGYWLDPAHGQITLTTTPEKPIVTHDIVAKRGVAWPVVVTCEGGLPAQADLLVTLHEVEDDQLREKWLSGVGGVSFSSPIDSTMTSLDATGVGAFTQCGDSGKLVLGVGGKGLQGVMTEFIVEPGFEITKVKTIEPVAESDKVTIIDEHGLKATIAKAEVTLKDGLPLLTFRLKRESPSQLQAIVGQVVNEAGNPLEAVRIGAAIGAEKGGSCDSGIVTTTDKEGRFDLKLPIYESKQKQHVSLIITKDGYAAFDSRRRNLPKKAGDPIDAGRLVMLTGHSIPIRVVDESGKPLAGAVVEPRGDYAHRRQGIRTDAQGRGVLSNLPAGVIRVFATYGSLSLQEQIVIDVKLKTNEEATLKLRDPAEQAAAPEASISVRAAQQDSPQPNSAASKLSILGSADGEKPTPAARLATIRAEVETAKKTFDDAYKNQPDKDVDDPEVEKLFQSFREKQKAAFTEAGEIAKADPKSAVAFDALEWRLLTPGGYYSPPLTSALELLREYHSTNPKIGPGIATLAYYPPWENDEGYQETVSLLKTVLEKNPDRAVRGNAALGLAWLAKRDATMAGVQGAANVKQLTAEAEKLFEAVIRDYGDCENLRKRGARTPTATLRGEAETELFELRNLQVGKPAPEIEGEDLSGAKFKLSEYQGKVRLLVFWASWCGPCMGAVPHERELVERFKSRPFALIGVNADDKREDAQIAVEKHKIPWRSFWNGKEGAGGPIAFAWNVRGWPTVYVIDHKGVIRHKYLHREKLEDALEKLIAEAEKDAAAK